MNHLTNWVEIPVSSISRAVSFYSHILGIELHQMPVGPNKYALFPSQDSFNCGALVEGDGYTPSMEGVTVYLDGGKDLNQVLDKVEAAGGQVLMPKTFLGEQAGYIGFFADPEGNRIGLQNL